MAKVKTQYLVGINFVREMFWDKQNRLCFDERFYDDTTKASTKVAVSECRIFRKESHSTELKASLIRDDFGRLSRDENGVVEIDFEEVKSAREFVVVDFKKCKSDMMVKKALRHGFVMKYADGTEKLFKRVSRSAAKSRTSKALFTCKDVHAVRQRCSYGAKFDEYEVISKMEARFGLIESSSWEISAVPTIDVVPDFEITRKHDVEIYDPETEELNLVPGFEKDYNPLDGQGTILPAYAAVVSHELEIISRADRDYVVQCLKINPDPRVNLIDNKFARIWAKIPSGFLIRFGFAKGFLVVYPHNLHTTDCNGDTVRTKGKVMKFWEEKEHTYNFNADIIFTDSMWKANFDKAYLTGVEMTTDEGETFTDYARLEVVRFAKQPKGLINMGYQYWQALSTDVNPQVLAKEKIDELQDTIFTNADHAKAFLGNIDMSNDADEYEASMTKAGGRIQKILETLNENAEMIKDPYIKKSLREMRDRYVRDMSHGRIPVPGANPFIVTAPELMFGETSKLNAGEYYYNGKYEQYAAFRSPLIHKSEAVVINTVNVHEYNGLFKDLLIFNPYDDTLPRMGGADTDGDTVAMTNEPRIVAGVQTGLPMLYDAGSNAEAEKVCDDSIYEFDYKTIVSDAPTIGEVTNMSTTWKDIAQNPKLMKEMGMTEDTIDYIVKILRFMQGWAIDYAKTGYFPNFPEMVNIETSPEWHAWSRKSYEAGNQNAKPFESRSRLGLLHKAVTRYMENKYYAVREDKSSSRDFTFEFSAAADLQLMEEIKPQVKLLERAYRHELSRIHDQEMDEDQLTDMIRLVVDKYQRAVMSIDADVATIGAAAYQVAYYENGTKGKSISFPWVVAYEGMLMNASASTDEKTKLRVARFTGHIDDIPHTLKFYKCESIGDDYKVKCKVPNGTYETYRKNGNLYIKTKNRANSRLKKIEKSRPVDITVPFDMVGFKANGYSAKEVLSALKANNGIVTVRAYKDSDNGEVRAAVFIGEQRMGSVAKQYKNHIAQYLPCELRVNNVEKLSATYVEAKSGLKKDAPFYALDTTLVSYIEEEVAPVKASRSHDEYASYDSYSMPSEPVQELEPIEWDELDTPAFPQFKPEIMEIIGSAPYFEFDIDPAGLNITAVAVRQIGAIKMGQVCADVVLTNTRGQKKVVKIEVVPGKQFGIVGDLPEMVKNYVLQIAHHELYRMHIERKAN